MEKVYNNYHKHDHISNIFTPDTHIKTTHYLERIQELGFGSYFTTNHGSGGDVFESLTLCNQYDIRCIYGIEAYIVKNPLEKDKRNYHIIIIPVDNTARKKLNLITSRANIEGYYYKPRLFLDDLLKLNPNEVYITTACIAGILSDKEAIKDIFIPLMQHFGKNMFLEVQNHNNEMQNRINNICVKLADKFNLELIAGNDSHYIYPHQAEERLKFLKGKGINYGDEDSFILDFPDYDEMFSRFKKQNILSDEQIHKAINNTLIFDDCEDIYIDKSIKMPSIYPNLSTDEKIDELKKHIGNKFQQIVKDENIQDNELEVYKQGIVSEMKVIEDTKEINTADYFLLNEKLVDLAVNKYGGVLTRTGRGCFTKDALVYTKQSMKTLDKVNVGDEVLSADGKWHKVLNTMAYDIEEPMIEFEYQKQGSSYKKYKNICTLDHKILVNRNGNINYIKAEELQLGDLLCSPKIKHENNYDEVIIDLNDYNDFGFEYDDKYIYEILQTSEKYKYSPRWCEKNINVNSVFCKKVIRGYRPTKHSGTELEKRLLSNTPFKTLDNYASYCKKRGFIRKKIKRYIKLDYITNTFIGLMYGDGWTLRNRALGLAVNRTSKNIFNRKVFYKMAEKLGIEEFIYVNYAKNRNLDQLIMNSKIVNNWFINNFFKSKKGKEKIFNTNLFNQDKRLLKWLYIGLYKSDGSLNLKSNKLSFDTTSMSLLSAYKTLDNIVSCMFPLALDVRFSFIDNRGYNNSESYKLRRQLRTIKKSIIEQDDDYWYLPIVKIIHHKSMSTTVYDLSIDENHSYTINNIIVHNSCGSYYINKILGMTQLDRFKLDIKLYPERFMSTARLLENKAMPDIDFNIVEQEPFIKASKELLGENGCYPMIAYGTMQSSEAFRNVCRSHGLQIDEYNEVAKNIEKYIDNEKWKPLFEETLLFKDTVVSASVHPCAFLLSNKNILEEYGVVKVGDKICVMITSGEADEYKMLKDDFLIVTVYKLISETFKLIGKPIMPLKELCESLDDKVWDLFEKKLTCTLNQVDGDWATSLLETFKPKNISDMAMFVACLRPFFNSWRDDFILRKPNVSKSPHLNKLLKSTHGFVLFQENLMQYFEWLGVTPSESIGLIKKISKKKIHPEDFKALETRLRSKWIENTGSIDYFDDTWDMIQSCISYGFCVSGNTRLYRNGNGNKYIPTIEEMYNIKNSHKYAVETNHLSLYKKYRKYGYGKALSMSEDNILYENDIIDIHYTGTRKVYRVKVESGATIDCTLNHKFPTPKGEFELSELNIGDSLYLKDSYQKRLNSRGLTTRLEKIISIEYIGKENVYSISMDNPYHTFTVESGIVTSNCSSHACGVAIDCLYGAYLKSHYPLEYYTVALENYSNDIEKTTKLMNELPYFDITIENIKFGKSSSHYNFDRDSRVIYKNVNSIKYCNSTIAEELMELSKNNKYDNFIDLLYDVKEHTSLNSKQLTILTILNFFSDFGNNKYLLDLTELFNEIGTSKILKKDKIEKLGIDECYVKKYSNKETKTQYRELDNRGLLYALSKNIKNNTLSIKEQVKSEIEYLGYTTYVNEKINENYYIVVNYKTYKDVTKPYFTLRKIKTGEEISTRITQSKIFKQNPFGELDILKVEGFTHKFKKKCIGGEWVEIDELEPILESYEVIG